MLYRLLKNKTKSAAVIISLSAVLLNVSCSDWMDIKPLNKMTTQDFWKTGSDVETVVRACYRTMQEEDFMRSIILGGELRADNTAEGSNLTEEQRFIFNADIQPSNSLVQWAPFYRLIGYCNTVLALAPDVTNEDPDFTPGILHAREAEVLTLRALAYFYLVRLYRDVPFVTKPSLDDTEPFYVSQSPENEILDRLIEDLKQAEVSAVRYGTSMTQTKGRITKNAVRALLADIYLWQSKYSECVEVCNRILSEVLTEEEYLLADKDLLTGYELRMVNPRTHSGNLGWSYAYTRIFGMKNSTESIFELQFNVSEIANKAINTIYGSVDASGQLSASLLEDWRLFLKDTDIRQKDSYLPKSGGRYKIFKYVGYERDENSMGISTYFYMPTSTANWIFYRLPDVMLMKAEALVEQGNENNLKEAMFLVNQTYMRSNPDLQLSDSLSFDQYSSKDRMRNLVFDERQRELLFEGKRWFDLLRRVRRDGSPRLTVDTYLARKYSSVSSAKPTNTLTIFDAWYLPIHKDEMKLNPYLEQNPYYKSVMEREESKNR